MFTVSCYVLHPLCQRFVRLWRYVQVVSDVLTFFLSMLCCQCAEAVPFSTSSSVDSKPSVQIFKAEAIMQRQNQGEPNEDRHDRSSEEPVKPHHLVIDFATRREDTPEIQKLCQQYWQNAKNQQEHNNMSSKSKTNNLIGLSKTGSHSDRRIGNQSIPAVHTHKKNNNKGNVQIALHSSTAMKYHT